MHGLQNIMRRESERAMSQQALPRVGIVTGYDRDRYAAKVRIQPEDVETGWLPVRSPWSGNGWGMFCPPSVGDEVEVQHQEGGKEAAYVSLRAFGDRIRPLSVPSGELWLVHQSGASLKLSNDGTAALTDGQGATISMNGDGTASIVATAMNISAPAVNGTGLFNAHDYYARGTPPIPDGTYRTGLGLSQDGYITILGGIIVAIQEAL